MFCTACGAPQREDARFCGACGRQLPRHSAQTVQSTLTATPPPSVAGAVTDVRPGPLQSRATVLTVVGYLALLWGASILAIAIANGTSLLSAIASAAWFIAYGAALIKWHRSAVWLGWFTAGAIGLATIASGFVPILILLWLLATGLATYVHRQLLKQ
jgi:hypothetical protein